MRFFPQEHARRIPTLRAVSRNHQANCLPGARGACAVHGLQRGSAMDIVHSAIPACRQALKGMDLKRLVALPTWVCHRFFLIRIAVTNIMSIPLAYRSSKTKHETSTWQNLRPQTNPHLVLVRHGLCPPELFEEGMSGTDVTPRHEPPLRSPCL
jgi:hypothetical protein